MTEHSTDTHDAEPELTDAARETVLHAITGYGDVGIDSRGSTGGVEVLSAERSDDPSQYPAAGDEVEVFEVVLNATGRLKLDEVMENQGLLLCAKGENPYIEASLKGFLNGKVLVEIIQG